jgi:hypothetical protein
MEGRSVKNSSQTATKYMRRKKATRSNSRLKKRRIELKKGELFNEVPSQCSPYGSSSRSYEAACALVLLLWWIL